ncbi:MAG: hypothetical protein QM813_07250 [Verrucomicrobiota bacterium]
MKTFLNLLAGVLIGVILGQIGRTVISPASPTTAKLVAPRVSSLPAKIALQPNREKWSRVESENYSNYVANLRAIGCPDPTITDIIFADLQSVVPTTGDTRLHQLALRDHLNTLGLPPIPALGNMVFSPEQMARVQAMGVLPAYLETPERSIERRKQAGLVTPEQEVTFKAEYEGYGPTIQRGLTGFRPTQSEFYSLVTSMTENSDAEFERQIGKILTPNRYEQFQKSHSFERIQVYKFTQQYPSARGKEDPLADLLQRKANLPYQEYRNALAGILDRAGFAAFIRAHPYGEIQRPAPLR